jgi:hypothetical protein
MNAVEPKDVMVALLGRDVAIVGIGLALMGAVVAFYVAFNTARTGSEYPLWLYIFYWLESLVVIGLALISVFTCNDWLVSHAYSRTGEADTPFNLAVRFFDLALFAVACDVGSDVVCGDLLDISAGVRSERAAAAATRASNRKPLKLGRGARRSGPLADCSQTPEASE